MSGGKSERTRLVSVPTKSITTILSVHGRHHEPFLRAFEFRPDNIAQSTLGTLVGVFEVNDRSEASSYIVNFLVSVLRKEYFINPRRGVTESLEAALHRVNLALAELVKHGSVSWLGRLSGVVASLDRDTIHFSVCGEAKLLLFRDGRASEISLGLASPEAATHPLKSFVEISSGGVLPGDTIALFSETVMSLFSLEQLAREISRMRLDRFAQFLKTAITNELPRAAALLITYDNPAPQSPPHTDKRPQHRRAIPDDQLNFFSARTYAERKRRKDSVAEAIHEDPHIPLALPEYTDKKTGHIYIQGERPPSETEAPVILSRLIGQLSDAHWVMLRTSRLVIRLGNTAWNRSGNSITTLLGRGRQLARQYKNRALKAASSEFPATSSDAPLPLKRTSALEDSGHRQLFRRLHARIPHTAKVWGALLVLLGSSITAVVWTIDSSDTPNPNIAPTQTASDVHPPALRSPDITLTKLSSNGALYTAKIGSAVYAVGQNGITEITSAQTYPLPVGFGTPRLATFMADLSLFFLLADTNTLYSFSPASARYSENAIPFPKGATPVALSAYLTYLYMLDDAGTLYRFPRVEGGFGSAKSWFAPGISRPTGVSIAVSEYLTLGSSEAPFLEQFSRGTAVTTFQFSNSSRALAPASIAFDPADGSLIVLDPTLPGLVLVTKEGVIRQELYHPEVASKQSLFLASDRTLLLSGADGILSLDALP